MFIIVILRSILDGRHACVFLEVFAEERGIGKLQVVSNLLHGHIGEAQTILDSLEGEETKHLTGAPIHSLHQQF